MIKAFINAQRVKQRLRDMSERSRTRVFRRVLREAAKPVVGELKTAWRGAKRRRGKVTREIATSQQARVRVWKKGDRKGTATLQIGANYSRGGFARLWHILENGFRHYGKNAVYRAAPAEIRQARAERDKYYEAAVGDVRQLAKTKEGRAELTQRYRAIGRQWRAEHPETERKISAAWSDRNKRRDSARSSGVARAVAGRRISRPIAAKSAQLLAKRAQDLMVAHVMKGAR